MAMLPHPAPPLVRALGSGNTAAEPELQQNPGYSSRSTCAAAWVQLLQHSHSPSVGNGAGGVQWHKTHRTLHLVLTCPRVEAQSFHPVLARTWVENGPSALLSAQGWRPYPPPSADVHGAPPRVAARSPPRRGRWGLPPAPSPAGAPSPLPPSLPRAQRLACPPPPPVARVGGRGVHHTHGRPI